MSSRPLLAPNSVKPLISQSGATSFNGPATIIQMLPGISYDISWSGTLTGTFDVEVSNTYRQNADGTLAVAGNWTVLPHSSFSGTFPTPAGSPGNGFLDVLGTSAYAVRLIWTAVSGTGTITVVPCGKVL